MSVVCLICVCYCIVCEVGLCVCVNDIEVRERLFHCSWFCLCWELIWFCKFWLISWCRYIYYINLYMWEIGCWSECGIVFCVFFMVCCYCGWLVFFCRWSVGVLVMFQCSYGYEWRWFWGFCCCWGFLFCVCFCWGLDVEFLFVEWIVFCCRVDKKG